MKYLCLGYYDVEKFQALPPAELDAIGKECRAHDEALKGTGKVSVVASLSMPQDWKSIRPRKGRPIVTDGPYTEAKEVAGAFFIVEAKDMAEAVEIASRHPAAHLGEAVGWGVEVRACDFFEQA
jgi:hypothetical protein